MDINDLRSVITVAAFGLYIAILVWAFRPASKAQFDEAARLPFHSE